MNHILRLSALCLFLATPSLACSPLPGENYDSFETLGPSAVQIGIAEVQSVDIVEDEDAQKACYRVRYRAVENLFGKMPAAFDVQTCTDGATQSELEDELAYEDNTLGLGYVTGAQVFLGLVVQTQNPPQYRYLRPSCWGALHMRLDFMEPKERAAFLHDITTAIQTARHQSETGNAGR